MSTITKKISGFDQPTIWYKFSKLAMQTKSANLGQGFPDWKSPDFYYESLIKNITSPTANHQYTRSFGSLKLVESIARNYKDYFKRNIDPLNEVLVSNGATSLLYCSITALVEEGDEVVVLEPFFDCYLPQVLYSGGKIRGVPMIPPKPRNKKEIKLKYELDENNYSDIPSSSNFIKDEWKIDFDLLRKTINEKTKVLVLNTPNNPTGKILSEEELDEIASIVRKYPNLYVIMDEVYEHMIFDNHKALPRMATRLWDRTISICSAGKIFSNTGIRIGWIVAPERLMKQVNAVHQYTCFCLYDPIQNTIADCLDLANDSYKNKTTYYDWIRLHYMNRRNYLLNEVVKTKHFENSNFWIPEGGYFAVSDITQEKVENKNYGFEDDNLMNVKDYKFNYTKDFNFTLNMANDKNVVGIPFTPFFTKENKHLGENFVRLAFCKEAITIKTAVDRLSV